MAGDDEVFGGAGHAGPGVKDGGGGVAAGSGRAADVEAGGGAGRRCLGRLCFGWGRRASSDCGGQGEQEIGAGHSTLLASRWAGGCEPACTGGSGARFASSPFTSTADISRQRRISSSSAVGSGSRMERRRRSSE